MKKTSLVLFPVLGALLLAGCTTTKRSGKKKKSSSETAQKTSQGGGGNTSQGGGGKTSQGGGGNTSQGGGGGGGSGSTVVLKNQENRVSLSDTEAVYQSDSWTVTIGKGSASQTVTEAVTASKAFEMRLYQNFTATFAGGSFTTLEVVYSTYEVSGKTYYFDFDIDGATKVLDNNYDTANTQGKATFTFSSAQTSVTVTASHQARVTSATFIA